MATKAHPEASAAAARLPESITSRDNRWLKQFRAALAGDTPRSSLGNARAASSDPASDAANAGVVAGIEGARLVETALEIAAGAGSTSQGAGRVARQGAGSDVRKGADGLEIIAVLWSDAGARHFARLAPLVPPGARLLRTNDRLFAQAAGTQAPQGIAALVRARLASFDDIVGSSGGSSGAGLPLILVLAGVQDPGNVGVLVRTAEAFGATGAAACAAGGIGTANPFGPKALRASAGAALRLPILRGAAAPVLVAQLRVAGVRVVAACPAYAAAAPPSAPPPGESSGRKVAAPWQVDWRGATALLVGNEGAGLPADLVRSADQIVAIPQAHRGADAGAMDSLNAAVAGAVLLYEAARQRESR